MFGNKCEHEWYETRRKQGIWNPTYIPQHTCRLCNKKEDCNIISIEKKSWAEVNNYYYTVYRCEVCGYDPDYDDD